MPGQGSHASVAEGRRPDLCDLLARGLEVAVGRQVSVRITSSASSEASACWEDSAWSKVENPHVGGGLRRAAEATASFQAAEAAL